ncbi:Vacuolar_sorting protein [Hexamita inflata]|uniref:Vacuolar_sorting protein n=1 Tax=Hexamita inflata TaxID=28002 RepID=A0ABP1HQX7_9EUKA
MDEIIQNFKKKGSFEWSWVNDLSSQLKLKVQKKDFGQFQPLSEMYMDFVKSVNEHYNSAFEPNNFEEFDLSVTPLIMPYLKETAYKFQLELDPDQSFSNEQFLQNCKKYSQMTQEEMNVNEKFILQTNNPHEKTIKALREIPQCKSFVEMSEVMNQAITLIYQETAKVNSALLTGDDLTDIIVYVVLKAAPSNLVQTIYAFHNHLPAYKLSGETGYNAMGINLAITVISQLTNEYFRKAGAVNENLFKTKYLIPEPQLLENYIGEDKSLIVEEENVVINGYITYYCLSYMVQQQVLKTFTVKCGCAGECEHKTVCVKVRLNPKISNYQAVALDRQLTGMKSQLCSSVDINGCILVTLKSFELISHWQQNLLLMQALNHYNIQQLTQVLILHAFGCVEEVAQNHHQKMLRKESSFSISQLLRSESLVERKRACIFVQTTDLDSNSQVLSNSYGGVSSCQLIKIVRILFSLLQIKPELYEQIEFDQIDQNFFQKMNSIPILSQFLKLLPSIEVQEFIFKREPIGLSIQGDIVNIFNECYLTAPGQIPYFQELNLNMDVITPFCLQIAIQLVQLACMMLKLEKVEIFSQEGFQDLTDQIKMFQQEKGIQTSGAFDALTFEELVKTNLKDFFLQTCQGPKAEIVTDIYGYE